METVKPIRMSEIKTEKRIKEKKKRMHFRSWGVVTKRNFRPLVGFTISFVCGSTLLFLYSQAEDLCRFFVPRQ